MIKRSIAAKDNSVWKDMDVMMLPITEETLTFGDEFMLVDNLDKPVDREISARFVATGPFKISFTCIVFCTRGTMSMRINLREFQLTAGEVFVGLPDSIGETIGMSDDCEVAIIAYAGNKFMSEPDASLSILFQKYFVDLPLFRPTTEEFEEALTIYHMMRKKLLQPNSRFVREALNGYMQVLGSNGFQWITTYSERVEAKAKADRSHIQFETFLKLVRQHYAEERDISFYADKMCLTPKYLSSVVYKVSGRYASEWIKEFVILEAKALLRSRQYTVQQVCDRLNFTNASFFGKYFKAAVGCSPGKYMLG